MENETQVLEMVVIEPVTVLEAYTKGESLDFAIDQVRDVVKCFDHDLSTDAGRKRTASLAAKVARVKTGLDQMGKDLTTKWKSQAKVVDNSRKDMREALDALKVEARQPLTDWEAEQAKEKALMEKLEAAEKLATQLEYDHEVGLLINEKMDRDAADAKAEAERQAAVDAEFEERLRQEREANIAQEAAERATREANDKAIFEKAQAEHKADQQKAALKEAEEAKQRAKLEHDEALKQAKVRQDQAVRDAEDKALREAQAKIEERLAEDQRLLDEQVAREANQSHRRKINNAVLADLVKAGLDEVAGKKLIKLIATGKVAHTIITY